MAKNGSASALHARGGKVPPPEPMETRLTMRAAMGASGRVERKGTGGQVPTASATTLEGVRPPGTSGVQAAERPGPGGRQA